MGPGHLSIGSAGSTIDMTSYVTKMTVSWKKNSSDSKKTLSGASIGGGATYTAQLSATVYQDPGDVGGMIDFTWAHKGDELPFSFVPTSGGRGVAGIVVVDPLDFGGEVGAKNTADLAWDCVGEPTLVADLS
jgi:hypothetical protein